MSDWWHDLQTRVDRPPALPRASLYVGAGALPVGSVEPALAQRMRADGLPIAPAPEGWRVDGATPDASLAAIAAWLRAQRVITGWRDELLAVDDAAGTRVAMIERAAVRALGITTRAVHLVGRAETGSVWVQQRAFDKATDPGRWDTLMGGLIAADETIAMTLARETWEEAGLRIDALRDVQACGLLTVRRPVVDGYMIERIHVFEALVPAAFEPMNQDGEVAAFECLSIAALCDRLHADAFTLEAALILGDALRRHGYAT